MSADALSARVRAAIAAHEQGAAFPFEELALAVFARQFSDIPAYRRFCERRGRTPSEVARWQEIPALPTSAFKALDLHCGPPRRVFLTSGTTQGRETRGRHCMPDPEIYRASALAHFRRMVLPDGARPLIVGLLAGPEVLPDSSLVQMVEWVREDLGQDEPLFLVDGDGFAPEIALARLRELGSRGKPLCLVGVRAVFTALLDWLRARGETAELPPDSRIVDTGGPKGGRTLSDSGFLRASWDLLGIPGYYCINEYGMTELSSQYYDDVLLQRFAGSNALRRKQAPPWMRSIAVDPETLEPLAAGETGILRHVDLANALSVLAVQTEDLGSVEGPSLVLRGRIPGAEPRGCALALSHLLEARS